MMPEGLKEIVSRIRNGDQAAFRELVVMYQQQAYRLAFRILGNEEEARDAVQESFVKIWQKIGFYDPAKKFTTWMNTILVNTSADRLRAMRRHTLVPFDNVAYRLPEMQHREQETQIDNRDLANLVHFLAKGLPDKQKLVFILRDLEGMSSEEVEAITEMEENAVKSNLYHARKNVREKLFNIMERERDVK